MKDQPAKSDEFMEGPGQCSLYRRAASISERQVLVRARTVSQIGTNGMFRVIMCVYGQAAYDGLNARPDA